MVRPANEPAGPHRQPMMSADSPEEQKQDQRRTDAADWERRGRQALVVIAFVLAIGALYLAKAAIVPVLFAALLALMLSPAVGALHRLHIPRALAAGIVVVALVAIVGACLNATWRPARDWLDTAPETIRTVERKLRPITRFIAKVESVQDQAGRVAGPVDGRTEATPVAMPAPSRWTVEHTTSWVVAVATTLILTFFLLAAGPSLLRRLDDARGASVASSPLLQVVEAVRVEIGRYFAAVTVSNVLLGIATTATMHALGMPNPLLWGLVAFLLNFVPYAGSATTLVLLTVVALVSFDGVGQAFAVAASYLLLTTIEGQVLQPILVGRRLDVSPLIVFLALWFGGWLWGVAGIALAMPLVVCGKALAMELTASAGAAREPETTVRRRAADWIAASNRRHRRPEEGRR